MTAMGNTGPVRLPSLIRRPVRSRLARGLVRHAVLLAVLGIILYPLLWMVGASFRPNNEIFNTLGIWPSNFTTDNYVEGWSMGDFAFSQYFFNSLLITLLSVVGSVVSSLLAAYAFARLDFPLRRTLFAIMVATLLLPYHVTLVPQYIMFNELQWIGTILPLVVPKLLATDAFFVFLMVQFIRSLPRELDDAARIDGCGFWGIFRRVIVPLSLPAMGTVAMFTFIFTWNDFLGPLLYLTQPGSWTVTQALNSFIDVTGPSAFGPLMAMATLSLAPVVAFFLMAQRLFVEGIATSGFK